MMKLGKEATTKSVYLHACIIIEHHLKEEIKRNKKSGKSVPVLSQETCNFGFGMAIHFYSNICIVEMMKVHSSSIS